LTTLRPSPNLSGIAISAKQKRFNYNNYNNWFKGMEKKEDADQWTRTRFAHPKTGPELVYSISKKLLNTSSAEWMASII
jgi:hypothetical protein